MKSYKEITDRYLKHNRKRIALTILGIILSVALITAVGLFMNSVQNDYVEQTKRDEGSFYIQIPNVGNKGYDKLKNNPKVENIGIMEKWNQCSLKDSKSIEIDKIDSKVISLLPDSYKAVKGKLPDKEGEIALENWILNYIGTSPKVGDTISLKMADGSAKNFKLTGVLANQSSDQYSGTALGITYSKEFNMKNSTVYLTVYKKADIRDTVNKMAKEYKGSILNTHLLDYTGNGDNKLTRQLYTVAGVIILIIVIATIAVIYNSFQISVVERMKQFGLLRAVGATPKQIKKVVLREASIMSVIGIPLGIISGTAALFIVGKIFSLLSNSAFSNIKIVIDYRTLIISAIVGIASIYISAMIPAKRAAKISPIQAISSGTSISKEKIRKNRGKFIKKFSNIEILMAFKNIKRNPKRFRTTVFSIVISIALFIFFTSFIGLMSKFQDTEVEDSKFQFMVSGIMDKNGHSSLRNDIVDKIKQNALTKNVEVSYGTYYSWTVFDNDKRDSYVNKYDTHTYHDLKAFGKDMSSMETFFDIYDDDKMNSIKSYIKSGTIDTDKMKSENGVVLVKNSLDRIKDKNYNGPLTDLKVGDTVYIDKNIVYGGVLGEDFNSNSSREINPKTDDKVKVKIAAVVDSAPYEFLTNGSGGILKIIMTKDVMKNITESDTSKLPYKMLEINIKDKKYEDKYNDFLEPLCDTNGLKYADTVREMKNYNDSLLEMRVLMYGFIAVISLIGVVNIVNTITTNLILRKKEIASLNAIGMTYKNIREMIVSEGAMYGIYGSFYGGIAGTVLSYLLYLSMNSIMTFKWSVPWKSIVIAASVSILVGLISVVKPLYTIKRQNIVEVIREE